MSKVNLTPFAGVLNQKNFVLNNQLNARETLINKPLVILDRKVSDLKSLVRDLESRANIVILNSEQSGIEQITQALDKYQHLSSLHLVAHGSPGCLYLGNSQLSIENINEYGKQLNLWRKFLIGKDFLVYGCQVAKEEGEFFLTKLSRLTGSNIAASQKNIGLTESGRYWNLEFQIGAEILSDLVFSPSLRTSYTGAFIRVGETSDFEDGTTQGWRVGQPDRHPAPPTNLPDGGPDGVDDNFLQVESFGGTGVGSRLVWFNNSSSWTGNYIEEGVTAIRASVINQGSQDLVLRIAFNGSGGRFVTTEGITLAPGNEWQEVTFKIEASDLTAVSGNDVDATLGNVSQIRFLNNSTPLFQGASTQAQLGIDNITALEEPESKPTVGISLSETDFQEGDELTVNFTVEGDIPEEGLTVLVESASLGALDEFSIFDAEGNPAFTTSGIEGLPEFEETGASSFLVKITEPDASVSLSIFDDGLDEGREEFNFSIVEGEIYDVDSDSATVAFSIDDRFNILDTAFTRFQNSSMPGASVYATGTETDALKSSLPGFVEDDMAFYASFEANDDLIAFG